MGAQDLNKEAERLHNEASRMIDDAQTLLQKANDYTGRGEMGPAEQNRNQANSLMQKAQDLETEATAKKNESLQLVSQAEALENEKARKESAHQQEMDRLNKQIAMLRGEGSIGSLI